MCKLLTMFVCLALLDYGESFCASQPAEDDVHVIKGEELYRGGDFAGALKEFQLAVEKDSKLIKAWKNIGWTYWKLGDIDKSIQIFEKLRGSSSDDVKIINTLAKLRTAGEDFEAAILLYDESLEIVPGQKEARFNRAKVYGWSGKHQKAISELKKLLYESPDDENVHLYLARFLMNVRKYQEAVKHWRFLVDRNPHDSRLKVGLAKATYWLGEYDEALKMLDEVLATEPGNLASLEFKANDAIFTKNYPKAVKILKEITNLAPDNTRYLNKLAMVSFETENYGDAVNFAALSLEQNSNQPGVRLFYADALRLNGEKSAALKEYESILELNPNNWRAKTGLKELYLENADYDKALEQLDSLVAMDNSNVYHGIEKAKILGHMKRYSDSIKNLKALLANIGADNSKQILVLLYHGLTHLERSDMLQVRNFKSQMQVLKEEGFAPVTCEDLHLAREGEKPLPENPVLITFDDARRDSFKYADPSLKRFRFKATMFAPISIIEKNDPFFCDWNALNYYKKTGRWEIQSHGGFAHEDVAVGPAKEEGTFLTNKKWLQDEGRLETEAEFVKRIEDDYRHSRNEVQKRLTNAVYAYAFPKGNFGQVEFSNYPWAATTNMSVVSGHFGMSFIQDAYGFNLENDNPYLMKRLEVPVEWTGEDLKKHIKTKSPRARAPLALADVYRWSGEERIALKLYNELVEEFPGNDEALMRKATLLAGNKSYDRAEEALQQVLSASPDNKAAKDKITEIENEFGAASDTGFSFFEDSHGREGTKWQEKFTYTGKQSLFFEPSFARIHLKEQTVENVSGNEYGLAAQYQKKFKLLYLYRAFPSRIAHNYVAEAVLPIPLVNRASFINAYENVDTAGSVRANVKAYRNQLSIYQMAPGGLKFYAKYQLFDFNDNNKRGSLNLSVYKTVLLKPDISFGYAFTSDDTKFVAQNYYSPNGLKVNEIRLSLRDKWSGEKFHLDGNFGYGKAKEKGVNERSVAEAEISSRYEFSRAFYILAAWRVSKTPTYKSNGNNFSLGWKF